MGAENVFVAGMARIWLAPVGTAAPAGVEGVPMPTGWHDVGLFTPDSLNWATEPSFEDVTAHQSKKPVRKIQTEDNATLEADLLEWSAEAFRAVYGGGRIERLQTQDGQTYYRFVPPEIGGREEVAICLELEDGNRKLRRIIPRAMQSEGVETSLPRTEAATLPLRMSVLGGDVGPDYYDLLGSGFSGAFDHMAEDVDEGGGNGGGDE